MAAARQWNLHSHAIVQASFAVEFATSAPAQTIREVLALHSKLKEKYPRRQEKRRGVVGIPADVLKGQEILTEVSEPVLAGVAFDSLFSNGSVECSVVLDEKTLTSVRADYHRWQTTWPEARKIFALILPVILERLDVVAFHLQYQNRFVWEGSPDGFRAEAVFRTDSQFLAPNVFEAPDLWHSNHGYFEYPDEPSKHQLLSTSDVNVVLPQRVGAEADAGWGLVAEVNLNHRVIHGVEHAGGTAKPVGTTNEVLGAEDGRGLLDHYLERMHDRNNWLMTRLINDEMCAKIELPSPE